MKQNNNITIVVASDNHYAILIAALLKSIDFNHKTEEHIDFHIIDDGISTNFRRKLESIVDPKRITIKWTKSKDVVPANVTIPVDSSAFPLTAYMRVFSPYVVDDSVERLIYFDVDTILNEDVSKLWYTDLGDYTIAAAQDSGKTVDCAWGGIPNYLELGLTADTMYFNSGVLIINTKKWRAEDTSIRVMKALSDYREHVRLADQYGLNVVMANKWLQLDPKWNWFAFQEDNKPYLVHFLDIKPIFKSYESQPIYKDQFFEYLNMTPWKGFKPISNNRRMLRKVVNKVKKGVMKLFR